MPLSDTHYAAIGRVAVEASLLEFRVCMLHVLLNNNTGDENELATRPNRQVRNELQHMCRAIGTDWALAVVDWLDEVRDMLWERHKLIHANWLLRPSHEGPETVWLRLERVRAADGSQVVQHSIETADAPAWLHLANRIQELEMRSGPHVIQGLRYCGLYDGPAGNVRTMRGPAV